MADQGPGADGFQYPLVPRACRLPSLHPERSACVPLTWNGGPLAIVVRGNRALAEAVRRAVGERIEAETFTDKQRGHARTAEHTPGGHIGRSVRRVEDPFGQIIRTRLFSHDYGQPSSSLACRLASYDHCSPLSGSASRSVAASTTSAGSSDCMAASTCWASRIATVASA